MTTLIRVLIRAGLVLGIGAGGGFVVAALIASFAILVHAAFRSESPAWTVADFYFALAIAFVIGTPVGVISFTCAYYTVLQRRVRVRDLYVLATGTLIAGLVGAVIALPFGMLTAPIGFVFGCMFLWERKTAHQ